MKLARRLAVLLVLGVMLVLSIALVSSVQREVAVFNTDMKRDHQVLGSALAVIAAKTWQTDGEAGVRELMLRVNSRESTVFARFELDPGLDLTPNLRRELLRKGIVQEEVKSNGADPILVSWVQVPDIAATRAAIKLTESTEARQRYVLSTVRRTIVIAVGIALLSLLIAVVVGLVVVARRVDALVRFARQIGIGEVGVRIPVTGHDELTDLADAMNGMATELEAARVSLEQESIAKLRALEQLRHADRLATVGKLASGIAHELGTPLNVVSGRAKMIVRSEGVSSTVVNNANIVVEQVARMTEIIRQLLGFARSSESRKQHCDMRHLIEQSAHLLTPLARKKSVEIKTTLPAYPVSLDVDQGQIHQVLTNLIVNGVQAMAGPGAVVARLDCVNRPDELDPSVNKRFAVITVCDQGKGIAEDALPHIFEPFFTTKGVGEGTGLGLSVAWGIVQEHGGQITARNLVGGGAEFVVELPFDLR